MASKKKAPKKQIQKDTDPLKMAQKEIVLLQRELQEKTHRVE